MQKQSTIISGEEIINSPPHLKRITMITKWLEENEHLLEATDAIQITLHVKRQNTTESVQGTILLLVKSK